MIQSLCVLAKVAEPELEVFNDPVNLVCKAKRTIFNFFVQILHKLVLNSGTFAKYPKFFHKARNLLLCFERSCLEVVDCVARGRRYVYCSLNRVIEVVHEIF